MLMFFRILFCFLKSILKILTGTSFKISKGLWEFQECFVFFHEPEVIELHIQCA